MPIRHWFQKSKRANRRARPRTVPAARPVGLEPLESRILLSAITVQTLDDTIAVDGSVSLREAIEAANTNTAVNEAIAGDPGNDTITFDPSLAGGTISLGSALPTLTDALTITGLGADELTLDAGGASRIFAVDDGNAAEIAVSIAGLTLTNGGGVGDGGAVRNAENLALFNVEITDSTATANGGGIYNSGTLLIRNSTLAGNLANTDGGGVFNAGGATLDVFNSTISGNDADANGGGIANASPGPGTITIASSTLTANRADVGGGGGDGGGVFTDAGDTLTLHSTLVAGNTLAGGGADDVAGGFDAAGAFNLIGASDGATGLTNPASQNLLGTAASPLDAALDPLADNGGPTRTHALGSTSPAIDAGDNPMLMGTDQRGPGFARDRGDGPDIGAFETLPDLDSIAVTFDFGYDETLFGGNDFFNDAQRRERLQQAADSIAGRFADDLDAILPGGSNTWSAVFTNPASGTQAVVDDLNIASNEIYVFAGGRDIGSLGLGGAGGFSSSGTSDWLETVGTRGEFDNTLPDDQVDDFGPWGGAITFDTVGTSWHFGETTTGLDGSENDFLSVALHEMTHLLGFSDGTDSFFNLIDTNDNTFTGPESVAEYDGAGNPPLGGDDGNDLSHWQADLQDNGQETAMDPNLTTGTRKLMTDLDFATLNDIGWDVTAADTTAPTLNTDLGGLVFDSSNPLTVGLDVEDDADAVSVDITIDGADASDITVFEEPGDQFARLNFVEPDGTTPIGSIIVQLFPGRGGEAVTRFETLATTDFPDDPDDDPFWTDVNAHRVIPGFIIQTGDAENGDGTGGSPLGDFNDQFELQGDFDTDTNTFDPGAVRFTGPGTLAMANAGADTNDSQWFITDRATPFLNFDSGGGGAHMIFGQLISGTGVFDDLIDSQTAPNSNGSVISPPLLSNVELITDQKDTSFTFTASPGWDGAATATITLDDGTNTTQQTIDLRTPAELGADPTLTPVDDRIIAPAGNGSTTINASDDSGLGVDQSLRQLGANNKLLPLIDFDPSTGVLSVDNPTQSFVADAVIEGVESGQTGFFPSQSSTTVPIFATADGAPNALGLAGSTGGSYLSTTIDGEILFAGTDDGRIDAFDIANPATPVLVDSINVNDAAWDLQVAGDTLFVAAENNGVISIDIANPADLTQLDALGSSAALGLDVSGDNLYVADAVDGLHIVDIADPANLSIDNTIANPGGGGGDAEVRDVVVEGDRLYAAELLFASPQAVAANGNVNILDLSGDPDNPTDLGQVTTAGNPWGIAVRDNTLFIPDLNVALRSVDVTDPTNPQVLDTLDLGAVAQPYRAIAVGDLLVAADLATGDSLFVDTTDPASLQLTDRFNTDTSVTISGIASIADNELAVPAGDGRVAMFDAAAQVALPDITVEQGATLLTDDQANAVDFGSAELGGSALQLVFTVTNEGQGTLNLGDLTLPTGYTLVEGLDATLAFNASDTFTVELPTDTAGTFDGQITIASDDPDEPTFNFPVTGEITIPPGATLVVGRHVFYENSAFDAAPAPGETDADAIATDKQALFLDEAAGTENVTSYNRGLNGLIVDIANIAFPNNIDAGDFDFASGNDDFPDGWAAVADPTVTVDEGGGAGGADRVTLIWADEDDVVKNAWLEVTVLSNGDTGLAGDDVFYFGNAIGETFNSAGNLFVDGSDLAGVRDNPRDFTDRAGVTNRFDFNRDQFVDGTDFAIARDNPTDFATNVELITPTAGAAPLMSEPNEDPLDAEPADLLAALPGPTARAAAEGDDQADADDESTLVDLLQDARSG